MVSILDEIEEALKQVDARVFYGTAVKIKRDERWDYTIFGRESATLNTNNTSLSTIYPVAVVREDYVPECMESEIINALSGIPGLRPEGSIVYDYTVKPGTTDIVEMMVIRFRHSRKLCG